MTTTMITRPVSRPPQAAGDEFTRVLTAINSHRARPARHPRSTAADLALGAHLLAAVRAQDAALPAHRRAPRTLAEMTARLDQAAAAAAVSSGLYEEEQDACGLCGNWKCTCGQNRTEVIAVGGPAGAAVA
ncbi:hypothetical protein ACIPPJ_30160 [Streptomyces sp. NPDC086091]|uniref:hypothetical protein n=1 Tax=Streptomyces sp. NPDC086091 TaxID=3365751 RepID=UPI0038284F5D